MVPCKRSLVAILAIGPLLFGGAQALAEKMLGAMEGITVALPDDFSCGESIRIGLIADDPALFSDSARLQRLAGQLVALMAFDCPDAENIMMEGRIDQEIVYRGVTAKRADWSVMTMLAPDSFASSDDATAPALSEDAPRQTGGLLPTLPDTGSESASLNQTTGKASSAIRLPGESPANAIAPGSSSAIDRLGGIGREAAATNDNYCLAKNFDGSLFTRGRQLKELFEGDFEALDEYDPVMLKVYLLKLNDYFGQAMNFVDPNCAGFYDPGLAPGFMQGVMNNLMGSPDATLQSGLAILGDIANLAQNPMAHMNRVANIEAEQNAGQTDGVRLARHYTCSSPEFKRLYENLAAYIRGRDPACASGWPGVQLACMRYVSAAGKSDNQTGSRCKCITNAMEGAGAPRDVADWLQANYDHGEHFGQVIAEYGLRKQVGGCLLD